MKGLHNIIYAFLLITALSIPAYSAEKMDDDAMSNVAGQAGVTIVFADFVLTHEQEHMAIGGTDGLGVPEAPEGAWFILNSDRVITLNLDNVIIDVDLVTIGRGNTSYNADFHDALFFKEDAGVTQKAVAVIDFGAARFYSFSNDSRMTLSFGNNKEGNDTARDGLSEPNLFTEEIAQFQIDGSAMTVQSEDAKMYVFAHADGNFEITPP